MKKLLFVYAVMMAAVSVCAQPITIIPRIGATSSTISTQYDEDIKAKTGFTLGVGVNYLVNQTFSVQAELNFIQKGYLEESSSSRSDFLDNFEQTPYTTTETSKGKQTLNYFEIPVLAKVIFGNKTKFFLNAGPSIGIGLGGKYTSESKSTIVYSYSDGDETESYSSDIKGNIKFGTMPDGADENDWYIDNRIDFGLQFGGGALIADRIMIEARYGLGLSNLYNSDYEVKNRVFQVTVGIPIRLY
ncbi:MAG: PorT family protein [Cyclobacteriaceae bacterium]|nr:PorT family protein [Cyclobacteriaceae bacterium]